MAERDAVVERNLQLQSEWYGAPLGERVRALLTRLELSQSAMAQMLGLSAPMLSQLMSGHRAKISNPAVLARLNAVEQLAHDPGFDQLPAGHVRQRLREISETATNPDGTTSQLVVTRDPGQQAPPPDPVPAIQALLREAASATEIANAADRLAPDFPDLAEFLRVYGTGRTADARAHLRKTLGQPS